jgi:hypothetical protein
MVVKMALSSSIIPVLALRLLQAWDRVPSAEEMAYETTLAVARQDMKNAARLAWDLFEVCDQEGETRGMS